VRSGKPARLTDASSGPPVSKEVFAVKISVFTVMLPDLTPEEAAQALKAAGYDGVEWRVTHVPEERRSEPPSFWGNNLCTFAPTDADAHRARALSEGAGLAIPNLGTYISVGDLNAVERAMRFAKITGAPQIRVGVGSLDGRTYAACFATAHAFLAQVERLAARYGVRALVETHHNTICPSASLAHRLVCGFQAEHVVGIYYSGNMVFEGYEDYRLGIELLGAYLAHVHVKNGAYARPAGEGVWLAGSSPLEDGVVDFPRLFAALALAGYDAWVSVEDFSAVRPSREALRYNLALIRQAIDQAL